MRTFSCSVAQEGFFAGPVLSVGGRMVSGRRSGADPDAELRRYREASRALGEKAEESLDGQTGGDVLVTVSAILSDEAFTRQVERGILEQGLDAVAAVQEAAGSLDARFAGLGSDYVRSRREDIRGVAQALVSFLERGPGAPDAPAASDGAFAVCGEEISPAQLVDIDERLIGGLLSARGSLTSHVAILAGSLGVPYLYGNPEAVEAARGASFVVIDSAAGTVVLDPDEGARAEAELRMARVLEERSALRALESGAGGGLPGEGGNASVCRTRVCANIESPKDIEALLASGADGVGLFRTEFLFMDKEKAPSEAEQLMAYTAVLDAMGEREVVIRTMDIGSDKAVAWLDLAREANPALGMRGARVSLEHDEVLATQLRALLRAAVHGNLKVMFPMIASAWEVDELLSRVRAVADDLVREGVPHAVPELGIMVETPAAAVCAGELASRVSFFSIGTNDLTQYALAVDREAMGLERYSDSRHEAVFRLIDMTVRGGHGRGVRTAVCGRLAADAGAVRRLVEIGVDELSVPVRKVRSVKRLVAEAEAELGVAPGLAASAGTGAETGTGAGAGACAAAGAGAQARPAPVEAASPGADVSGPMVAAPATGELIPMAEIPDEVFSSGYLGECFGIVPANGSVYAPVSGTVSVVARTEHSVTIAADDGRTILVHVGIGTARLTERAFVLHVGAGTRVEAGQLIMEADLGVIERAGLSSVIVVAELS